MYVAFGILFSYLYKDKKKKLIYKFSSFCSFLAFNTITIVQIFNYYVDGALMISILLILYACIVESDKEKI